MEKSRGIENQNTVKGLFIMKTFFIVLSMVCLFSFITANGLAERCPTPDEIKTQGLGRWHVFYEGESADNMIQELKEKVNDFEQANYVYDPIPDAGAQCIYKDQNNSEMELYLVRSDLKINQNDSVWRNNGISFSCI